MADMRILDVHPESPLFGYVRPGYSLVSINGEKVLDNIDYTFKLADEHVEVVFADPKGEEILFDFEYATADDLGLTLDDRKVRTCKNKCIFCFVHQQPQGMRRALYVMDEDYRLSFTHGNFITLSNTTEEDMARIIEQRLSPMYVSVHATDDKLRRCMMKNEKLKPIIPQLRYLGDNGITIHTQVVLCPNVNDGDALEQTITELADLYPTVETLAVVPVGLTRYRDNLPNLRTYRPDEAGPIIDSIERHQQRYLKELGTRFVWPADEFYVAAQRPVPKLHVYEDMQQFENGVGMVREFVTLFNRRKQHLRDLKTDKRIRFLTGGSAYPFLKQDILPGLIDDVGLRIQLQRIENKFWGKTVTVSGLLTGRDMLDQTRDNRDQFDIAVIPPNCLNNDDLFLDNLSLEQFRLAMGKEVVVGSYNVAETIREICARDTAAREIRRISA
ncbi:DUF512 domain-containing protein [candidate division GN15 bacterium]|nr:DUF512 domain-containing protein [candidate division GN15 bacterium]